jgi:ElaB/YqjD/DUF883 family membrane-anchored ribosome-binding protein
MSETTSATNDHADRTVDELKALLREAEAALANVGAEAGDEISGLRDRLRSAFAEGKNTFGRAADLARKQVARADDLVRANPYVSIGVAAAAGLLLGCLLTLTCSRRN